MAETIFSRFRFSRSRFFLPALLAVIGGCGRAPEPSQPQAPPVLVRTAAVSAAPYSTVATVLASQLTPA